MNAVQTSLADAIVAKLSDATGVDELVIADMVRAERKRLGCLRDSPGRIEVASRMLEWFEHAASNDLPQIRAAGLFVWLSRQSPAKAWATLAGLKYSGISAVTL